MSNRAVTNRPFKFGANDRREFITQDSEVTMVAINDENGNPNFLGRAKVGVALSEPKWQIQKLTFDSNNSVTRTQWPQNDEGNASAEYEFIWSDVSNLTITGITKANPAVVTVSSIGSLQNGDEIIIQGVTGMTEVNFDGSNIYTVANIAGATFELSGIDSSSYGVYSAGGTVEYGDVLQYTYS